MNYVRLEVIVGSGCVLCCAVLRKLCTKYLALIRHLLL